MRVCLDTNVLVAAFATRGLCEDLFRIVLAEHELFLSRAILEELERVLVARLNIPASRVGGITDFLQAEATVVSPEGPAELPRRDPDDRWILATAIAAEADILVSGDRDLLDLGDRAPLKIAFPREFWEQLR